MAIENEAGFQRIAARLKGIEAIDRADLEPLLEEWELILVEDNRKGILEGTDKDGNPMPEVTYRGQAAAGKVKARSGATYGTNAKQSRLATVREMRMKGGKLTGVSPKGATRSYGDALRFKGISSHTARNYLGQATILPNNNLSRRMYEKLDGPPLAPRRESSRVISNFFTEHDAAEMSATGGWAEVVSPKGVPFLMAHFKGERNLPVRDLRGVRPWGMARARSAVRKWAAWLLGGKS